jgi:hypothetical protein
MDQSHGKDDLPRGLFVTGRGYLLPPVIWSLYFAIVYAVQGAGCAVAVEPPGPEGFGPLRAILPALTLIAAVAIAGCGFWSWRTWQRVREAEERGREFQRASFLANGTLLSAGLFLIGTLWVGLPILFLDPCRGHTVMW